MDPVGSWDPLENMVGPLRALFAKAAKARGLDRLRVIFGPPAWIPAVGEVRGEPAPRVSPVAAGGGSSS